METTQLAMLEAHLDNDLHRRLWIALWTMRRAARSTTLGLTFTRTPWRTVAPIRAYHGSSTKLASMNRILFLMIRHDRAPNDFQSNVSMGRIFVRESPTQPIFTRLVFFSSSVFEIESARGQSKFFFKQKNSPRLGDAQKI